MYLSVNSPNTPVTSLQSRLQKPFAFLAHLDKWASFLYHQSVHGLAKEEIYSCIGKSEAFWGTLF